MDWLAVFATNPGTLDSFQTWLKERARACADAALDGPDGDIPMLRGKREAFQEIQAYVINNLTLVQREHAGTVTQIPLRRL